MKLASILPVQDLDSFYNQPYAMLLAHLADYYPPCSNKNCYKIMDNSLIELGGAVSIDKVIAAADKCGANEIILPDVFRDGEATATLAEKLCAELAERNCPYHLMAVCHGHTVEEFTACFRRLEKIPNLYCIGIPKVTLELTPEGRPGLEQIWANTAKNIHLLGVWTNLEELTRYKHPEKIRSVDTCIPALLSQTTNYAFIDRPKTHTINLLIDRINKDNYDAIMMQLRALHFVE